MNAVSESARRVPVRHHTDVLVVGSGSAGLATAVSAAREGVDVVLVERYGFLGGVLTAVTLGSICGLYTVTPDAIRTIVKGFAGELIERLRSAGGAGDPVRWLQTASLPYDPVILRTVADDLVAEAGISLYLHNLAVATIVSESRVEGVVFEGPDGRWACRAGVVVDCTGDAQVAANAGCGFDLDVAALQSPTTMFRLGGVCTEMLEELTRARLHEYLEQAVAAGMDLPRTAGGVFSFRPGVVHLNVTRVSEHQRPPNPLSSTELTHAEISGRRQMVLYCEAFRRYVPGFENCYLLDCGTQIGIRESRRVTGEYQLTVSDVRNERRFDDAIACCAWPVEEHSGGRATRWVWLRPGGYYQIPLRCLIPETTDGLLIAGRCASATHEAQASMRVAATCMAMGQAAGVTAAACIAGIPPRAVPAETVRARLSAQGAFLGDRPGEGQSQTECGTHVGGTTT